MTEERCKIVIAYWRQRHKKTFNKALLDRTLLRRENINLQREVALLTIPKQEVDVEGRKIINRWIY